MTELITLSTIIHAHIDIITEFYMFNSVGIQQYNTIQYIGRAEYNRLKLISWDNYLDPIGICLSY